MESKRNKWDCKEGGGSRCLRKAKFELLALTATKLKGNGEVSWCGINSIIAGIQEMERAGEGVAVPLNDVWHSVVIDFGYVSSRIL